MTKRTPPNSNYPAWSDAKFWQFIRSGLRAKWVRWPPRYEILKDGRRAVKGKRHKWEIKCSVCKKWHQQKNIQVDHIEPVGTLKAYEHLPEFVRKLFVPKEKLRIVCVKCHAKITKKWREDGT